MKNNELQEMMDNLREISDIIELTSFKLVLLEASKKGNSAGKNLFEVLRKYVSEKNAMNIMIEFGKNLKL